MKCFCFLFNIVDSLVECLLWSCFWQFLLLELVLLLHLHCLLLKLILWERRLLWGRCRIIPVGRVPFHKYWRRCAWFSSSWTEPILVSSSTVPWKHLLRDLGWIGLKRDLRTIMICFYCCCPLLRRSRRSGSLHQHFKCFNQLLDYLL